MGLTRSEPEDTGTPEVALGAEVDNTETVLEALDAPGSCTCMLEFKIPPVGGWLGVTLNSLIAAADLNAVNWVVYAD